MGPYKPLRNWVDDHPLLYGNNGSLDPQNDGFGSGISFSTMMIFGVHVSFSKGVAAKIDKTSR